MPAVRINDDGNSKYRFDRTEHLFFYVVTNLTTPTSEAAAIAEGLPTRGTVIQDGVVVFENEFRKSLNSESPYVEIWSSYGRASITGSLGTRRSSYQTVEWDLISIPNWTAHTPPVGPPYYVYIPTEAQVAVPRPRVNRVRYKQTSGLSEDTVADFDAVNVKKIRTINGNAFQYLGTTLYIGADNQQRVTVRYQSRASMPAIAAGTFTGYNANVPVLPVNADYIPQFPSNPTTIGSIAVTDPATLYGTLASIPWD